MDRDAVRVDHREHVDQLPRRVGPRAAGGRVAPVDRSSVVSGEKVTLRISWQVPVCEQLAVPVSELPVPGLSVLRMTRRQQRLFSRRGRPLERRQRQVGAMARPKAGCRLAVVNLPV